MNQAFCVKVDREEFTYGAMTKKWFMSVVYVIVDL